MKENGFRTDVVMARIWRRMLEDLTPFLGPERADFKVASDKLLLGDIRGFRLALDQIRLPLWSSAKHFKAVYQLKNFTRRYIFVDDVFSADEMSWATWVKYQSTQQRISTPINWDPLFFCGLLEEWRHLCQEILGQYDEEEHLRNCRFAKNACVGHPAKRRRLDYKVKGPITGSLAHLEFLRRAMDEDPHLSAALKGARWRETTHLELQLVPKSYKSLRAIMPDTLAGSFYSYGLGKVIQSRLKDVGLDIEHLQFRHRRLAEFASRDYRGAKRRLATLDLSSASDSITVDLLRRILPQKWYEKVMQGRISKFRYNGEIYDLQSACTMGLGHTFPLETLVFYVLVKGIMNVYAPGRSGLVSVYGDDIILPTWAVRPVVDVFKRLHLLVNDEKSFWGLCDFRESCGGDFFRGASVRPANPEFTGGRVSRRALVSLLYTTANAILLRWDDMTMSGTIAAIAHMIHALDGFVLSVPPDFPDESGLKVTPGTFQTCELESTNFGSRVVRYWRCSPAVSSVSSEDAFLWDWLRNNREREANAPLSERSVVTVRKRRRGRKLCYQAYAVDPGKATQVAEAPHRVIVP